MSKYSRTTRLFSIVIVGVFASGCAHLGESGKGPDASGYYAGNWYGPNPEKPLGELTCTIEPSGEGNWDALFFATFGGVGEYEVNLAGVTEGDSILFKGSVDLGETSGGVFDWTGIIIDDGFDGEYTSQFISGTFKMTKSSKPETD